MRALVLFVGACAVTAQVGQAERDDITARMQSAQGPIAACYASTLDPAHPVQGMMYVAFTTYSTGEFSGVRVTGDELKDPRVERCVVAEVSKLRLAQPTGQTFTVSYPIHFSIAK